MPTSWKRARRGLLIGTHSGKRPWTRCSRRYPRRAVRNPRSSPSHSDRTESEGSMAARSPTDDYVLLVDDSAELSDTLTEVLEAAGYRVAQACQGKQALSYLRTAPPPAAILLDLH